jgi:hypothetical protein
MSFTGDENHDFPLDQAALWTANYRKLNPTATKGHYFGGTALRNLLNQTNCVGLRFYYALDDKGQKQLIIVGVDRDENDLFQGLIAERSIGCPPFCGTKNPLNG